jgi:hypothetical protein
MIDSPPKNTSNNTTKANWNLLVGRPKSPPHLVPPDVGIKEDKPPADSKEDLLQKQTAADMAANRGLRETYANKAYCLAVGCLFMWTLLLVVSGIHNAFHGREMWSDKVIIAATTGVTVSVLAAFLGVIRGLFPGNGSSQK